MYYEYFITFPQEVDVFWRRKRSLPSVLFLCGRYVLLGNAAISFAVRTLYGSLVRHGHSITVLILTSRMRDIKQTEVSGATHVMYIKLY